MRSHYAYRADDILHIWVEKKEFLKLRTKKYRKFFGLYSLIYAKLIQVQNWKNRKN